MSLQVWLPLNGNLNNQGLYDLKTASVQNGVSIDNNGKIGKCYTNSGTTANIPTTVNLTLSQFTICAWVKYNSSSSAWQRAFGLVGNTNNDKIGFCTEHSNGTSLGFHFTIDKSGTNTTIFDVYSSKITVGQWVHYAMMYSGSKYYIYENGILVSTGNVNIPNTTITIKELRLFGGILSYSSKCSLNDVRIYDNCLSPKEIKEISKGLMLHYKLEGYGRENLIKGNFSCISTNSSYSSIGNVETTLTAEDILANKGKTLCLSFDVESTGASISSVTTYQKDRFGIHGSIKYTVNGGTSTQNYPLILFSLGMSGRRYVTWTIPSNLVSIENNLSFAIQTNPSNGFAKPTDGNNTTWYVKNVKLEWGSVPTPWCPNPTDALYTALGYNDNVEYDCSGYGHNGTNNSIIVDSDSPKYSCCYQFQKGNSYCYFDNLFLNGLSNNYTFSWWYYSDVPTSYTMMWGSAILGNTGYDSNRTFQILWGLYSSTLIFGSNNYEDILPPSGSGQISPPPEKTWHHYVLVGGDTVKLYVDGQLYGIVNKKVSLPDIKAIILNGHNTTDTHFQLDCKMSDFRLYSTNLSDSDILELYQTSANIDNKGNLYCYELKEV